MRCLRSGDGRWVLCPLWRSARQAFTQVGRRGSYDLRKLRGKQLVDKPGRTRRYHVPHPASRTITALLTLRDQVIGPILAGVRSPRMGRKPKIWTAIDRHYEHLRVEFQSLFTDLRLATPAEATSAWTTNCRSEAASA